MQQEAHVLQDASAQHGHQQLPQLGQPAKPLSLDIAHPIQESAAQDTTHGLQQAPADAPSQVQQVGGQGGSDNMQWHTVGLSGQGVDQRPIAPTHEYDTSVGLPMGVLGHLYPSPFANAADASSGPLWDWQTAAAL